MSRPVKRTKTTSAVEEITFDPDARADYLTGFHKRKQQRIKHAQEEAAKKEKEFRIEQRRQIREQRQKDLAKHVETVNAMIKKPELEDSEKDPDEGFLASTDAAVPDRENHNEEDVAREEEYIDEDKYTTVTVEPMNLSESEDGDGSEDDNSGQHNKSAEEGEGEPKKRTWTKQKPSTGKPKKKRKKFRYETKVERKTERSKQKAKNSAAAKARRSATSRD